MGILYDHTRLAGTIKRGFCTKLTGTSKWVFYDYTRLAGTSKWVFCMITLDWLGQVNGYSVRLH